MIAHTKPDGTVVYPDLSDLRKKSAFCRALADIRQVKVENGSGATGRIVELRTPSGLSADIALDRGGDLMRLNWRGHELGWHGAVGAPAPWPTPDTEDGLGFLRGFDGFLVTCGLDHHGIPTRTDASDFAYPLRGNQQHPLHGRIATCRADLHRAEIDWDHRQEVVVNLAVRQATLFGETLQLERSYRIPLFEPRVILHDRVSNCGYRPTRHGVLYHFNIGYPLLDKSSRLIGRNWRLENRLDNGAAVPTDDHVEIVECGPSPRTELGSCEIGIRNPDLGVTLNLRFDAEALPHTALWRAFRSGIFALGLEPQTDLTGSSGLQPSLAPCETRDYKIEIIASEA